MRTVGVLALMGGCLTTNALDRKLSAMGDGCEVDQECALFFDGCTMRNYAILVEEREKASRLYARRGTCDIDIDSECWDGSALTRCDLGACVPRTCPVEPDTGGPPS